MKEQRGRIAALLVAAFSLLPVYGLARTFATGLHASSDESQWEHVIAHEQRFIQAVQIGTSSRG